MSLLFYLKKQPKIIVLIIMFFSFRAYTSEILLQGFNWESFRYGHDTGISWYKRLNKQVPNLREVGFTGIWLPPPSEAYDGEGNLANHSRGYMPTNLYDLDTWYGSKKELIDLNHDLRKAGISPIADIVINHRAASAKDERGCWTIFESPNWDATAVVNNDSMGCGLGSPDTGYEINSFADIDHNNDSVRYSLAEWLQWLRKDIGFRGLRYDVSHGYAGKFVAYYNQSFKKDFQEEPFFSIGEVWTMGPEKWEWSDQIGQRDEIVHWIDSTWKNITSPSNASFAFDFSNRKSLHMAIVKNEFGRLVNESGKPMGVMGTWPEKSVTFIENHDTGSTQQRDLFSFDPNVLLQGYAYILTHPGTPMVYYDHMYYFEGKMYFQIKDMMQLRHRLGIHSGSSVEIIEASNGLYAAEIDGKLAMKIGPKLWSPKGADWQMILFGHNFAIFEKKN